MILVRLIFWNAIIQLLLVNISVCFFAEAKKENGNKYQSVTIHASLSGISCMPQEKKALFSVFDKQKPII